MENRDAKPGLSHLFLLFDVFDCSGEEMNALINLFMQCLEYNRSRLGDMRAYFVAPDYFEPIWRLYFDPLIIKQVLQGDDQTKNEALNKQAYRSILRQEVQVLWSDGRKDRYSDGMVSPRKPVNDFAHDCLKSCHDENELVSLLDQINLPLFNSKHVLPHWSKLYKYLQNEERFTLKIVKLLFEKLNIIHLVNCEVELYHLLLDLFESLTKLTDQEQMFLKDKLVQLIEKLLLHQTEDSTKNTIELTKRICAKTPAKNNNNGHHYFLFLLKDLLPIYQSSNSLNAIKSVDSEMIFWYIEHLLEQRKDSNQLMTEHCDALLYILKILSKYTDENYLKFIFDRVSIYSTDPFTFRMIESSISPSTTLATFVRSIVDTEIKDLLKSFQLTISNDFISVLITILEALTNNASTHITLFQSDELHQVVKKWLKVEEDPSTTNRLIFFLIDIGLSKYNRYSVNIADFFLEDYLKKFLTMNFQDQSPLSHLIYFLSSVSSEEQTTKSLIQTRAEILLKNLFSQTENLDEKNEELVDSFVSHLTSLNKEILKPSLRSTFIQLISPYIPDLMGLLGQSDRIKQESIKLLGQILDLTDKERLELTRNLMINSLDDEFNALTTQNQEEEEKDKVQEIFFFSSEEVKKLDVHRIRSEDFNEGRLFLSELEKSEQRTVDTLLRERISKQRSNQLKISKESSSDRLVLTSTSLENVLKILDVLNDPTPILLEGNTGVGKSATILEASKRVQRKLIRYNMSSRVTIDDLIGKVMLIFDETIQMTRFQFFQGPFTQAFINGYWILFDELNLAQDTVLQAIESALDTKQLTIYNSGSADESVSVHSMHKDFRLFATQNPNTGFFKDKREKLSAAFLSRFRPLVFSELSFDEWWEIAQQRLYPFLKDESSSYATFLVKDFNKNLRNAINDPNQKYLEAGPYAEISIRELLKWVKQIIWQKQHGNWPKDGKERGAILSFSAWCVYGARYRGDGRILIKNILTDNGKGYWGNPALETETIRINEKRQEIHFDEIRCSTQIGYSPIENPQQEWKRVFTLAGPQIVPFNEQIWSIAVNVHSSICEKMLTEQFILKHGIYRIDYSWLWNWLTSTAQIHHQINEFALFGFKLYIGRFRHTEAHNIVRECFNKNIQQVNFLINKLEFGFIQPEIPFILTKRVLSTLKQVAFNTNIQQPILLTGPEGCGKSDLLLTLAWLNGQQINQLNITPETEPSTLIGQIVPNEKQIDDTENDEKKLIWQDGYVTRSYINGHWILLDNFNSAESSVLERLNPILEENPMLILTEKGEVDELDMKPNYRLFATMTPPDSRYSAGNANELSPSLYNRFAIVHMIDMDKDSDELIQLAEGLLSDEDEGYSELATKLIREIFDFLAKTVTNISKLTVRNIARFLDSTYRLHQRFKGSMDRISILWTAYHVTIANQFKGEILKESMTNRIKELFRSHQPNCEFHQPPFTTWIKDNNEHILTPSRLNYCNAVLGAVVCNIPLLLEGPAAVGKTALISHLCKHIDYQRMFHRDNIQPAKLERVNNTDTTTIQDYLGTYLPVNDGFVFQKGALYRAMENGWWFLADEFNLADPSVMNILFPLLEGKNSILIPTSGKIITAKAGFHFFATQNDATYANRHQLPISLRNRFLEIQFDDFPQNELSIILQKRNQNRQTTIQPQSADDIAAFYHRLIKTRSRITFRELVKWLHRHQLFSSKKENWSLTGLSLLAGKYPIESTIRQQLIISLNNTWPHVIIPSNPEVKIEETGANFVLFKENDLSVEVETKSFKQSLILSSPKSFQRSLVRIALAIHAGEPVLLVGPTSSKTFLVETWAKLINRHDELVKIHLTPESEAADLVGEIQPYTFLDLLKQLPIIAQRFIQRFRSLCRNQNRPDLTENNLDIVLYNLTNLIIEDLPKEITNFEEIYSRDEQKRQEKEALQNQFPALRAQAEIFLLQPTIDEIHNEDSEDIIETNNEPIRTTTSDQYCIDYGHGPRIYRYCDDDEVDENDRETPTWSEDSLQYACYEIDDDDGYGGCTTNHPVQTTEDSTLSFEPQSSTPTETIDHEESKDKIDQIALPDTTSQLDDGYDIFPHMPETSRIYSEPAFESQPSVAEGDGYPNLVNSLATSTIFKSHLESLPVQSMRQTEFHSGLTQIITNIRREFQAILANITYSSFTAKDVTLLDYQSKYQNAWDCLTDGNADRTKPIFLFNDGPVITAAKCGGILFLEDLDLPNQAVIERLNSMLEPNPSLKLTEDITRRTEKNEDEIPLSKNFQIFASVHQDELHQLVKLSPATRSRFTEIYIPAYNDTELANLTKSALNQQKSETDDVDFIVEQMFSLRTKIRSDSEWKFSNDVHLLFRWIDFINNHHKAVSLVGRVSLGARFFYFDFLSSSKHLTLFNEWINSSPKPSIFQEFSSIFQIPDGSHGAITSDSLLSDKSVFPFLVENDSIILQYTKVRFLLKNSVDPIEKLKELKKKFFCVPTPTLINQIARIIAATSSKSPLLLEGLPGIGKTQVVREVCSLVGKECERINFSANTSLDQLIGCIVPRCVNNARVFQWQEGRVISAIRAKRWILFDELNLASPEVLEGLTPLFYRGISHYTISTTGEKVPIEDVLVFATMNPSTIGGGRSRLPRSISNLFTIVQVNDYTEDELRMILHKLFLTEIINNRITVKQLDALFDMQVSFKLHLSEGLIGRTGGPYSVNLRDLSKFRDVYYHCIKSQLEHYRSLSTVIDENENENDEEKKNSEELSPSMDDSTARLLSIRKFAQVVYACQFQGQNDFKKACEIINEKFPMSIQIENNNCSIDISSATVVRIGSIYMKTGTEIPSSTNLGLIHTKRTVRQLESLAVACQSQRTVLLEGEICSGKTSLVIELSRITRNKLIIIPLHENFETTDLIGSWLPSLSQKRGHPVLNKIELLFKDIIKFLLLIAMPLSTAKSNKIVFEKIKEILQLRRSTLNGKLEEMCSNEIVALKKVEKILQLFTHLPQYEAKVLVSCFIPQTMDFVEKLKQLRLNTKSEMAFTFVESEFVQAIQEGWWVLLDNINSAPSEVLERLNSLTEDNPMLSLYENSNGKILRKDDGTIHKNFRLFTTANLNRIYSNKLSSAFLNRVIRIWLPPIDDIDQNEEKKSNLYELLSSQLMNIPAGKQFARILVLIHYHVKEYVQNRQLIYPNDFQVTYRLIEQCVQTLKSLINENVPPVDACIYSLFRCYCSSLSDHDQCRFFLSQLQDVITKLDLHSSSMIFSTPNDQFNAKQDRHIQEEKFIQSKFIQLENFFIEFITNLMNILLQDGKLTDEIRNIFLLFFDEILLPMTPNDIQLIQLKQKIIHKTELSMIFNSLLQIKQIYVTNYSDEISKSLQNLFSISSKSLEFLSQQISQLLNKYIRNTSFSDPQKRFHFLQRSLRIIETFSQFFQSNFFQSLEPMIHLEKFLQTILFHLRRILIFKDRLSSYDILLEHSFNSIRKKYFDQTNEDFHVNTMSLKSFDHVQSNPIRSTKKDMRKIVEYLLFDLERKSLTREIIEHYSVLLEWIRIRWTFDDYLTKSIRDSLEKNLSITRQFINECELKFSSWQLNKTIAKIIEDTVSTLPVESDPTFNEYLRTKEQIESLQKKIGEKKKETQTIQTNSGQYSLSSGREFFDSTDDHMVSTHAENAFRSDNHMTLRRVGNVFRSEDHDFQTALADAEIELGRLNRDLMYLNEKHEENANKYQRLIKNSMEGRKEFRSSMQKVFQSDSYLFICKRYEQADSDQLNSLCQYLRKSRSNRTLINSDGFLDIQAILSTPFGKELISCENLLHSPLIFFLCTFYFLPDFLHQSRIRILSNWNELIEDKTDLRTFNENVFLIYCPNENQYDCVLLKIFNEPKKIKVKFLSLARDVPTNQFEDYLEKNLPEGISSRIEEDSLITIGDYIPNDDPHRFAFRTVQILRDPILGHSDPLPPLESSIPFVS
ncbi:unnamed protein product [Adineta steineri]|uniref:Midasin n=1 Tax=Adineta steineri TaxID=433720 RepID=A0A814ENI1_9BILA|nr:unnamed protein product [Adineta steineri]CAF3743474.1 unnamed protein product [Adineta steineri]